MYCYLCRTRRGTLRILITILLMTISMVSHAGLGSDERFSLQEGDIVFQQSKSAQSAAIQAATGSRYTHVGLITMRKKTPYVLEAVNPVRIISFKKWKAPQSVFNLKINSFMSFERIMQPFVQILATSLKLRSHW